MNMVRIIHLFRKWANHIFSSKEDITDSEVFLLITPPPTTEQVLDNLFNALISRDSSTSMGKTYASIFPIGERTREENLALLQSNEFLMEMLEENPPQDGVPDLKLDVSKQIELLKSELKNQP